MQTVVPGPVERRLADIGRRAPLVGSTLRWLGRYGEWALLAPPAHGFNWIVWAGPALILVLGAFIISRLVRPGSGAGPGAGAQGTPPPEAPKQEQAEAEDP